MFTKSISYWAFPGGLEGTAPVADVFKKAKSAGFDAVEVCLSGTGDVSLQTTEQTAKTIIQTANTEGIQIASVATGLFWGKSLSDNDPAVRAEALEIGKKLIDVAAWLNAGAVLIIPGSVDVFFDSTIPVIDYATVYGRATEAIGILEKHARANKIAIGIENVWNKFLIDPMAMKVFIDQFNSEWVGSYFDVGNCVVNGYPEQWIRLLGKRIKRVHVKDYVRSVSTADGFVDLLSGDVNWTEVMKALTEVGYNSYVTAEMIPLYKQNPEVRIDNTSRAMNAILNI